MNKKQNSVKKLFGTDGVRGVANSEPMTVDIALKLGKAAGYVFKDQNRRHKIIIGKDTRLSGYMFETALAAGICSMGVDVLLVGPMPTPAMAFLISSLRADAGVVISASHNPFEDNGIKFFSRDGYKLPDSKEKEIEELIFSGKIDGMRAEAQDVGKAFRVPDARGRYIEFLKNTFPHDLDLTGMKVVLDCANGAAYRIAPDALEELGAEVIPIGIKPNGKNINLNCGSMHPEAIRAAVVENGADIGIALDGDADRAVFADETGAEIDGDATLAICGADMLETKRLAKNTVVATVMSNYGLEKVIASKGGKVVRAQVGDRYVVEEIRRGGYNLGGEQSGHVIFHDYTTTGDGMVTALQLLSVIRRKGRKLSKLAGILKRTPQKLLDIDVSEKRKMESMKPVLSAIKAAEKALSGKGRVLVRYSGTQMKARVLVEGEDPAQIAKLAEGIAGEIKKAIGGKNER